MAESKVVQIVRSYRAEIDKNERTVLSELGERWLLVQREIENDLYALAAQAVNKRDDGYPTSQATIYSLDRYQHMLEQSKYQIDRYNQSAEKTIESAEKENIQIGLSSANDAIGALGISVDWNRLNVEAFESMVGITSAGSPLSDLLSADYGDAVRGISNALTSGITLGKPAKTIADEMMNGATIGFDRSLLIARTEINRAYRTANIEQYRRSGVVAGFRRLVYKPTACLACLMMDGDFYTLDQELWDHPAGKCTSVPCLSKDDPIDWQTGREWFLEQDSEYQKDLMGLSRFAAWKEDKINLTDLVHLKHNDIWGPAPAVRTLAEVGVTKAGTDRKIYYNNYVKEPQITETVVKMAEAIGADMFGLEYRLKSLKRYLEKFEEDLAETKKIPEIKDVVRYTFTGSVENIVELTEKAIEGFGKAGYETIKIKNLWIDGDGSYKGINTFIRAKNGTIFEMQYHTYESIDVKEVQGLHKLYEKYRVMKDKTTPEAVELHRKMVEMSSVLVDPVGIERIISK